MNDFQTIMYLVFMFIGMAILIHSALCIHKTNQTSNWPTTVGTVLHCELLEKPSDNYERNYITTVSYEYKVGSQSYTGRRIAYGFREDYNPGLVNEDVHAILKNAHHVSVRYNPANPVESCLAVGIHLSIQIRFWFSLSFTSISAVFLLWQSTHTITCDVLIACTIITLLITLSLGLIRRDNVLLKSIQVLSRNEA